MEPAPGLNVFVGANAQGKSNLLEAISLLGTGKSFRTARERELVRDGFDLAVASGSAALDAGAVRLQGTIAITPRGTRKLYAVNDRGVRYARYLGSLRVVTFVPADLQLVASSPSGRRALLNAGLAQESPTYYHDLARYRKTLLQKGALLRAPVVDEELIGVYNHALVESGTRLMLARRQFVRDLEVEASAAHAQWSGGERLAVRYEPSLPFETPTAEAVEAAFSAALRAAAPVERLRGMTTVGPHRDDLGLYLEDRPLAAYGSQGQQRTAVLALKVGEYRVMHQRSGEAPLLLLDDVLSELDPDRANAFLRGVGSFEQAFITATHLPEGLDAARLYAVSAGRVSAA